MDEKEPAPKQATLETVKLYWRECRRDWKLALPGLLLPGLGTTLVLYVPPLIIARLLSLITEDRLDTVNATKYVLAFGGFYLLGETLWRIAIHLLIKLEARGHSRLLSFAMDELLKRDVAFFSNNFAGSLTKKTLSFARNFEVVIDTTAFNISTNIVPLVFVIIVLWAISPWIIAALLGILALFLIIVVPLIRYRRRLVDAREAASNVVAGRTADIYTNAETVKIFAREEDELTTYHHLAEDYLAKAKRSWNFQNLRIDTIVSPLYIIVNTTGLAIALYLSQRGVAPIETVFLSFTYFTTYTRGMWEFNNIYRGLESRLTDAAQFTQLLEHEPGVKDPARPEKPRIKRGDIKFDQVQFRYNPQNVDVFGNLNLTIKSGDKVGLVGPSGGGKTTLTKLLLRFADIQSGKITIDGQDISRITQYDLRQFIAFVPQEPILFHRSLRENIRYGQPEATDEEVYEAARLAHAAEFIDKLPLGYDSLVGERGMKLSGGQKQRVAIARAMLVKAPILVLDEATSALDSKSEKLIASALDNLMKNRTTIVIAHRLSTIRKLDRIIVMKEGEVVEEGSHRSLIARRGLYAELWGHQSGDFLEE